MHDQDRHHHNQTSDPQKSNQFQLIKIQLATLPVCHCPLRPGLGYISVFMAYLVFIQHGD
jgi:hypothetical protein